MADVAIGFVYDFASNEAFYAVKGEGASLNGQRIAGPRERRTTDGRLELLCIETSDASAIASVAAQLSEEAFRWRIFGSIANAMCQVAAGRVDAMINVSRCRIIDAAAAALIVSEAGGTVAFSVDNPELSLETRIHLATAQTHETANRLLGLVA
jgi:myo-inositol-1(or 4)-monophosphatase